MQGPSYARLRAAVVLIGIVAAIAVMTWYWRNGGAQVFADLLARAAALPGVTSATLAKSTPAVDWSDRALVFADGATADTAIEAADAARRSGHRHVLYCPAWKDAPALLADLVQPDDAIVTLGAGDINRLAQQLVAEEAP